MHGLKLAIVAFFALVVSAFLPAFSQTTVSDPNDPIYQQIDAWATRGVLRNLPQLRPYTGAMINGLLREVIATGSSDDAQAAQVWLDILGEQGLKFRADARANAAIGSSGKSYFLGAGPGISLNTLSKEGLGLTGRVEALASKGSTKSVTPFGSGYDRDIGYEADSGLGGGFTVLQDLNSAMTFGNESLGIQAGFMRGSWGPIFDDGVVVGPQAPASGQLGFSWRGTGLNADIGFYMLQQGFTDGVTRMSAPLVGGNVTDMTQNNLVGLSGQKYLMIHDINWSPSNWITLGLLESVVWVDRFEPLYFLPLSELFTSQSIASWGDNSFVGFSGSLYLPQNLRFDGMAYADDLDFSGMIKGDFDTKWKLAIQGALSWAPPNPYLQKLALDYTAVGPYTYTHWAEVTVGSNSYIGALAYTNAGKNIGPDLDPDSDRVTLKATSKQVEGFQATGILRLIRHGNASAGVNGVTSNASSVTGNATGNLGDPGEIFTGIVNGLIAETANIFQANYATGTTPQYLRFLTQSVIETSYQAGLSLTWSKRVAGLGRLEAGASYLFEYIANAEVADVGPVAGNTSVKNYLQFTGGFGF